MRKMYKEPKTDVASLEAAMNICHVSADGNVPVVDGEFNGKSEAPKRIF